MGWRHFYFNEWLGAAWRHSFGRADLISGAIGTAAGAIIPRFWPDRAASMMPDLSWQIPLGTLGALVLARLIVAPYWIVRQRDGVIEELRRQLGAADTLSVEVGVGELVIATVNPFVFSGPHGSSPEISSGIYIFIRNVRLINKSTQRAVLLAVSLRRKRDDQEWTYDAVKLPSSVSNPMFSYSYGFLGLLNEYALPQLVSLDHSKGDTGRTAFRLPHPGTKGLADKLAELQRCEFEIDVLDTLTELRVPRRSLRQPEKGWRVVS